MASAAFLLTIASLAFLGAGAIDPLLEDGVWTRIGSGSRRLWSRVVLRLARAWSTLHRHLGKIVARLLRKPASPFTVTANLVGPSPVGSLQVTVSTSYPDTAAEIKAIREATRDLQVRMIAMEQDSPKALADALTSERRETLRRGWRAFKYIIVEIALEVAAAVVSRL